MDFAIRNDAKEWFKHIRKGSGGRSKAQLELDFDILYLCFLFGVRWRLQRDIPASEVSQLVENYPGQYKNYGRLYVALLLRSELDRLGVCVDEMDDKEMVYEQIAKLVDHSSPNYLSDFGMREFNRYAHGGFEKMTELIEQAPQSLESFLVVVFNLLSRVEHLAEDVD